MAVVIVGKSDFRDIIRDRKQRGADHLDEVWNGTYVMSPEADLTHQFLAKRLVRALDDALADVPGALVFPTVNISDRDENWKKNYRVPDVAVFLPGNPAQDRGTHWFGGPDFAVEILSRGDRARKKLAFYAKVGVRELLLVDRQPWAVELHRAEAGVWSLVGTSDLERPECLRSEALGLSFRLVAGPKRPLVEVIGPGPGQPFLA
jgi:Uma2 family endonuclease